MTDPMTPADFAQFLESLKVTKEHTTEAHILAVRGILYRYRGQIEDSDMDEILRIFDSLEANAKPPTLLEDVKTGMRALMRDVDLAYAEPHQASAKRRHAGELACLEWLKLSEASK